MAISCAAFGCQQIVIIPNLVKMWRFAKLEVSAFKYILASPTRHFSSWEYSCIIMP